MKDVLMRFEAATCPQELAHAGPAFTEKQLPCERRSMLEAGIVPQNGRVSFSEVASAVVPRWKSY